MQRIKRNVTNLLHGRRARAALAILVVCGALLTLALVVAPTAQSAGLFGGDKNSGEEDMRKKANKLNNDGNHKEALELFQQLALDPKTNVRMVGNDMDQAIGCLQTLNRMKEVDAFRESVIDVHVKNWRLLYSAAHNYLNTQHQGFIIAGEFERGQHRGGGKPADAFERDRVRALQLMVLAMKAAEAEPAPGKGEVGGFYREFANILMRGRFGQHESWRLQYLTNIDELPDYEEGLFNRWGYRGGGGATRGAPVDEDGKPVFHHLPKSWKEAKSDGERWRWCLLMAQELSPGMADQIRMDFADFQMQQFGVQTMAQYSWWGRMQQDDGAKDESGTFALHTLKETETIAKLATGVKRFELPDEFNFIKIYQQIASEDQSARRLEAREKLGGIFENRRQYPRAAGYWREVIGLASSTQKERAQKRLDQIVDNWGAFENVMSQPAGKGATVEYRFRNGEKVEFEAFEIKVPTLLQDVKNFIKTRPNQLDYNKINIGNIGHRLVYENETKYIGKQAAAWALELEPRPAHYDKRVTVTTPLQKAGAYLLVAKMKGGNVSRIIIWLSDTAIVKKPLDKETLHFIADAVTGEPIAKANVEFFGYWHKHIKRNTYETLIENFAEFSDKDGLIFLGPDRLKANHQWIITATTDDGRFAYLGFTGVWHGRRYDQEYNQTKIFTITDRPVYRPGQKVKFKFWVRKAQYDQEDVSQFANQNFGVEIRNPKNEKPFNQSFKADAYGGFDGEWEIPADATLGVYRIYLPGHGGGGTFRVEEYKKPEFEVKVEAPTEPVMLGEEIPVSVEAKYYFGAPVTKAKLKYKVTRTSHSANWYPVGIWDWYYGPGYWWFAYDYDWYPGWQKWGCFRPSPWWWPHRSDPPEIVMEGETPIGEDGTYKIKIDTTLAKEVHGDQDHRYSITAEVVDESRRTIVGTGQVLVARRPFKVYAWVNRGHFRVGDTVHASFSAQTLDNKPVQGKGELNLFKISYDADSKPVETSVRKWALDTNAEGRALQQLQASEAGQYRLAYVVTDAKEHQIEGGYVFTVMGEGADGADFRFNDIELVADKREYGDGDKVRLQVNANRRGGTVLLFERPANSVYLRPKVLRLKGKSATEEIAVTKKDMPNFFVEALTVSNGKVHVEAREIVVPPEKRVLELEVLPSKEEYKPGEKGTVKVKLTDHTGEPFVGSTVMTVYDKAVEYISGGSNVPEIKAFFWKWRRHHNPRTESSLERQFANLLKQGEIGMSFLGVFGQSVATEMDAIGYGARGGGEKGLRMAKSSNGPPMPAMAMADGMAAEVAAPGMMREMEAKDEGGAPGGAAAGGEAVQPTVRTKFADTAFWIAALETAKDGTAEIEITMPENLTGWKIKTWAMGHGTKVGEAEALVVTKKNLMLRMQAPRFFVEKDEVVLSANIHNYLKGKKKVTAYLEIEDPCLEPSEGGRKFRFSEAGATPELWGYKIGQEIEIEAGGEQRVDWRVRVVKEGEAVIRMFALTDEESDAMEMKFPVYVHGMEKQVPYSGYIKPEDETAKIELDVPKDRRINESRLEIRYSPTLAAAMVDALPYMVDYPYGCTEQTLNRFLPTVITQKILLDMGLDLKEIEKKRTNLNAQEIGDDVERAKDWGWAKGREPWRSWKNPVFDEAEVQRMVKEGVKALTEMQLGDGGWGWFNGYRERSWPHTTAYVVHGLQLAVENDVALVPGVLDRGVKWLERYQQEQITRLKNWPKEKDPRKQYADNLDAFVYMVLGDAKIEDDDMREFLYRDRNHLAVYAKSMFGIALHQQDHAEQRDMLIRNIEQFLVRDDENQTAYLNLGNEGYWWCWYGSEYEAHGYYLKLLAKTGRAKDWKAPYLVKYLLNNRKHATYWKSTRDTSVVIEAFADYLKATDEHKPDMTVEIFVDGKKRQEAKITTENLFTFNNKFVMIGDAVETGKHTVEVRKQGDGPLYFNAYLTYFSLEDFITKAGLEVKVNRDVYKLERVDKSIKAAGSRGQALDQKVEKYNRVLLKNDATLKSGDLVEIELVIESKNDYEYLVFEDMKAAGFEAVEVRSGYTGNDMGAYVEFRDNRVAFFVRRLARGKHSVSYRLRAEIPGRFSALPTRGYAMYAPELRGNSDEIKLRIED